MAEPAKQSAKVIPLQLGPARIQGHEFALNVWVVTVEAGTTIEQMESRDYWAHVANKLRPYDEIKVRSDDGAFYAHFLVLACDRTWAQVHRLSYHDLLPAAAKAEIPDEYEIKWGGPYLLHRVIRKSDKAVLKENFQTKLDAMQWLDEYRKTVGVPAKP